MGRASQIRSDRCCGSPGWDLPNLNLANCHDDRGHWQHHLWPSPHAHSYHNKMDWRSIHWGKLIFCTKDYYNYVITVDYIKCCLIATILTCWRGTLDNILQSYFIIIDALAPHSLIHWRIKILRYFA